MSFLFPYISFNLLQFSLLNTCLYFALLFGIYSLIQLFLDNQAFLQKVFKPNSPLLLGIQSWDYNKVLFSTANSTNISLIHNNLIVGSWAPFYGSSLTIGSLSYTIPSSALAHLPADISHHDDVTSSLSNVGPT